MACLWRILSITVLLALALPQAAWVLARAGCCAGAPCDDAEEEQEEGCPPSCDHCVSGPNASRVLSAPLAGMPVPLHGLAILQPHFHDVTPPDPLVAGVFHPPRSV